VSRITAYLKACRVEYLPAEIIGVFIPFLLSGSFSLEMPVIEAIIVFFLLYWCGFLINALEDVEVDLIRNTKGMLHLQWRNWEKTF